MRSAAWQGDWEVTQPFGCTSLTVEPWWQQAQCHWHCGVDIGMYTGTPLYAARDGRVTALSYGILGIQVTGRTEIDYYVHIDRAVVGFGAQVVQGQLVAYSGAKVPSGGSLTGPHLHFEVNTGHLNEPDSSIDPIPVLQQAFSSGSGSLGGPEVLDTNDPVVQQIYADLGRLMSDLTSVKINVSNVYFALGLPAANPADPTASKSPVLEQIKADIAAAKGGGGSVDLSPVLTAIGKLQAKLDKDLA